MQEALGQSGHWLNDTEDESSGTKDSEEEEYSDSDRSYDTGVGTDTDRWRTYTADEGTDVDHWRRGSDEENVSRLAERLLYDLIIILSVVRSLPEHS